MSLLSESEAEDEHRRGWRMTLDQLLSRGEVRAELIEFDVPMTSARAAAEALGCSEAAILKSLVIEGEGLRYLVAVLPGHRRIDWEKLKQETGIVQPRFVPGPRVLAITGYPAGGVPPVGHCPGVQVVIDASVLDLGTGYGGGGRPEVLLRIDAEELVRATGGHIVQIAR
jgi:Cys-tRNA(Pro)/Cys-tRNA(Cys) deacylase